MTVNKMYLLRPQEDATQNAFQHLAKRRLRTFGTHRLRSRIGVKKSGKDTFHPGAGLVRFDAAGYTRALRWGLLDFHALSDIIFFRHGGAL